MNKSAVRWSVDWWGPCPKDENGDNDRDSQPEYTHSVESKDAAIEYAKKRAPESEDGFCWVQSYHLEVLYEGCEPERVWNEDGFEVDKDGVRT